MCIDESLVLVHADAGLFIWVQVVSDGDIGVVVRRSHLGVKLLGRVLQLLLLLILYIDQALIEISSGNHSLI